MNRAAICHADQEFFLANAIHDLCSYFLSKNLINYPLNELKMQIYKKDGLKMKDLKVVQRKFFLMRLLAYSIVCEFLSILASILLTRSICFVS